METAAELVRDISGGSMLAAALLQVLAEMRMRIGHDPDGSDTFDRALHVLGEWDVLSAAGVSCPGAVFDPAAAPARAEVRAILERSRPLLARLVRVA